jgi:hypothetical protein
MRFSTLGIVREGANRGEEERVKREDQVGG